MKRCFPLLFIAAIAASSYACASNDQKSAETAAEHTSKTSSSTGTKPKVAPSKTTFANDNVKDVEAAASDIENALQKADSYQLDAAITSLQETTKAHPKAFIAHYDLGLLYERKPDVAMARSAYESALKAEPNFYPALLALVRIDIRNGDTAKAIQTADQWMLRHKDIFNYNYAKLEALIADGQYESAITQCRALLKKDEANARLRYYLASAEFEKKRYRLADFIIGESLDINPTDPEALFLRARIYDALSVEEVAFIPKIASTLDAVITLNPNFIEALWMRANIYYEASNYAKAEELYRHILQLSPDHVGAHVNLANTLKTVDRGPEAETLLKRAKELDPKNALVDFAFGTLYLNFEIIKLPMDDMDRLKLAKKHFESAESLWTKKEDKDLVKGYIRTTNDAIETLQAMLDAEALFGPVSDSESDTGGEGETESSPESFRVDDGAESTTDNFRVD